MLTSQHGTAIRPDKRFFLSGSVTRKDGWPESESNINCAGMTFNAISTPTGFELDYYGTMTLHFVPAE